MSAVNTIPLRPTDKERKEITPQNIPVIINMHKLPIWTSGHWREQWGTYKGLETEKFPGCSPSSCFHAMLSANLEMQ